MKIKSIFITILSLLVASGGFNASGQIGPQKPDTFINPDIGTYFIMDLDSIVQFSYPDLSDSSRLSRWDYTKDQISGIMTSMKYSWVAADREYISNHRYEIGYTENGSQSYKAHYIYNWALKRWRGCDSDGCGKKEWQFDENGYQISHTQSYWSKNQRDWVRFNQRLNEYDSYGNQTLSAHYSRDQENGPWIGSYKYEYSYKQNNKEWASIFYSWDYLINDWRFISRSISYYPNQNITLTDQFYYNNQKEWELLDIYKSEIIREDSIETTTSYSQNNPLSDWIPLIKDISHLNSEGKPILLLRYSWKSDMDSWIPFHRSEIKYDDDGRLSMKAGYAWSQNDSTWKGRVAQKMFYGRRTYKYNDQGLLSLYTNFDWDLEKDVWIGQDDGQIALFYNENGDVSDEIHYDWNNQNEDFTKSLKISTYYNLTNQIVSQSQCAWDEEKAEWKTILQYFYYYNSSSTGFNQYPQTEISIYPNPSSGIINITGLDQAAIVKIYSSHGQLLKSVNHVINTIDISDISSGIYLLTIKYGDVFYKNTIVRK